MEPLSVVSGIMRPSIHVLGLPRVLNISPRRPQEVKLPQLGPFDVDKPPPPSLNDQAPHLTGKPLGHGCTLKHVS